VLTTARPADSRKTYCKVCNNAFINRFLALDCCKKDQSNEKNLSKWTLFGAVKTLRRQGSTIPFKMYHVLLSRAPSSETYFTFFMSKEPCKIIFTTFMCLAKVAQRGTRLGQLFRFLILTWGEAFLAICFCMWEGFGQVVLLCLYFYILQQ